MLRPLVFTDDQIKTIEDAETQQTNLPTKTYRIDFNRSEIYSQFIDEDEALRQAAVKIIFTMRDQYLVYSSDYGCEIWYLIGKNYSIDFLKMEVPRLITEALMEDDRIKDVTNFTVDKVDDNLNVSFDLTSNFGKNVNVEVTI